MCRINVLILFLVGNMVFPCHSNSQINPKLKAELDSLMLLDSKYRLEIHRILSNEEYQDSVARNFQVSPMKYAEDIMSKQELLDEQNYRFVDSLIERFGYPGKSLVSDTTSDVAWHIIQHSPHIEKHYKLIKKAARQGEIPLSLYAKMKDRKLLQRGKKQVYGTQSESFTTEDGQIHFKISAMRFPKGVNKRRKKMGLENLIYIENFSKPL